MSETTAEFVHWDGNRMRIRKGRTVIVRREDGIIDDVRLFSTPTTAELFASNANAFERVVSSNPNHKPLKYEVR